MNDLIGERIKSLRKERKLTLKQIADHTNLSISFLSQVERSKSSITLESLKKISEALGVNPSYFFSKSDSKDATTVMRNVIKTNTLHNPFFYMDLAGKIKNPLFNPILVLLNPGANREDSYSHSGQEFLYVLEGKLTIIIDKEEHDLNPFDCIFLDSTTPHNWINKTDSIVKFLCISSTPV
ncbi:helix-turn-helix domain-containing protein [Cytobacillus solani]|uniref:DNA-binding protein n=1 Tax=Cytobacillus solani TaxID=1637975 RepID=A0A0Q3VGM8_9BACI|nr:XRE family transcriptional regulator [Cytobacillus solani]KOP81778.1 DNA-binding protein [Bacillus sp. FJAT-21945]KQL18715.1 DNA-binding protein [Cytobacillus solani]USK56698.1 XRE family transcriptional regulator [Cytobacillus solani]